jgi:hypothetical protein
LQLLRLAHDVDHIVVGEVQRSQGPISGSAHVESKIVRGGMIL